MFCMHEIAREGKSLLEVSYNHECLTNAYLLGASQSALHYHSNLQLFNNMYESTFDNIVFRNVIQVATLASTIT